MTGKTSGGGAFMQSGTAYTANKNYAQKRTDARGKSVTSDTDSNLGTLKSITDPNGQKVEYSYDVMKRVQTVKTTADGKTYQNGHTYDKDKLKTVSHNTVSDTANDVAYTFSYDAAGRPISVKVGTQTLSTTAYNTDTTVGGVTYGNGGKVHYSYDVFKRVTGLRYDDEASDRYSYDYGVHGEIARVTDSVLNRQASSEYDLANRPMRITHREGTAHLYTGEVKYDVYNNLQAFKEKVGPSQTPYETTFAYDNENRPTTLSYGGAANKAAYSYDVLGRISQKTLTVGGRAYETGYEYEAGGHGPGSTTPLIKTLTQNGKTLIYAYDDTGNILSVDSHGTEPPISPGDYITEITDEAGQPLYAPEDPTNRLCALVEVPAPPIPDSKVTYTYDRLGQLIRTNDPYDTEAGALGTTWVYTYDRGGNILSKTAYAYTMGTVGTAVKTGTYTYGDANWKDKLTAYNGTTITYDAIGNPLNDGTWTYSWQAGRQLKSMSKPGANISYAYNADGLRVQKTVNGTVTHYTLHGKNIVHMVQGSNTLHFYYDAQNRPSMVDFNGVKCGYLHNLQGDIISIVDQNGNTVVEYRYDPWGKPLHKAGSLASTLGTLNPFRYRGYVYDEETGFYATATRYYNPAWGRFINGDTFLGRTGALLSHNGFAYCKNSPSIFSDPSGHVEKRAWYAGVVEWVANLFPSVSTKLNAPHYGKDEKTLALNYPLAALNVDAYSEIAGKTTDRIFGPGATNMDGTLANAFKHAYWNALMVNGFWPSLAERFANAHEEPLVSRWDETYLGTTIGAHTEMDYYYNALGRSIGQQRFPDNITTNYCIAQAVLSAITNDKSQVLIWDYGYTIVDDLGLGLIK